MTDKYETVQLSYIVHKYSSYSGNYVPENIISNRPTDQMSRWFTDSTTPPQYIILKLDSPAIVDTIKFGKFIKPHVSDLRKFQVFGGTDENNLSLLLSAGLKKDNSAETFRLRQRTSEGLHLPVQYIKIVPLQSWGPAYNYTIWYVELSGRNNHELIKYALETINLRKEEEAVRLVLKHLRRRRYTDAFEALSRETGVTLEGPLQARLWNALVENGDYKLAEEIMDQAVAEGEFDWYMSWQPYTPVWKLRSPCSAKVEEKLISHAESTCAAHNGCSDVIQETVEDEDSSLDKYAEACDARPGPRGGHQLVVDSNTGTLYLFGGFNGTEDLDDLWSYDTHTDSWRLLCAHSALAGGPPPCSCHKMVYDPVSKRLYTLGRYLNNAQRLPSNMNSELYSYDVVSDTWRLECADTAAAGGPRLVFDHQICIDPDTQTVYVFGGRVLPANTEESVQPQYSGLYAYYIQSNTWQQLLADQHDLDAPQPRVSHSMLFHPVQRRLYMFAGQRNKEHLVDLWWWHVDSGQYGALQRCNGSRAPPAASFTQRATLLPCNDEMFVLSGMSKEKDKRVCNTLWLYSIERDTWSLVWSNSSVSSNEPRPRYAHQLVLDTNTKTHYLFGGNPGSSCPRVRLDDLWSLELQRGSVSAAASTARARLREHAYTELARLQETRPAALRYLQHDLHDALDHSDPRQVCRFHALATALFAQPQSPSASSCPSLSPRGVRALARRRARARSGSREGALHAVFGADDVIPEPVEPFECFPEPVPDTWDVGPEDDTVTTPEDDTRATRIQLYDYLTHYFRPSTVPPKGDVVDLVTL